MKEKQFDKNLAKFMEEISSQVVDGATIIHCEMGDGDIDGELKAFYVPQNSRWIVLLSANAYDSDEAFRVEYVNFTGKALNLLSPILVNRIKEIHKDD